MSFSTRTLAFTIFSLVSVAAFAQSDSVPAKKSKEKTDQDEPKTAGLRKITTQSQLRGGNFDVNIDEEALEARIESAIEQAMASVEVALEKLEINIEPIEIDLGQLDELRALDNLEDIHIDPIHINIPDMDIDIDIEPIEVNIPDIDIDLDDIDIDNDFDRNDDDEDNEDYRSDGLRKVSIDRDQDQDKEKDKLKDKSDKEKDKSLKKDKVKSKEEKDKTKGLKKIN